MMGAEAPTSEDSRPGKSNDKSLGKADQPSKKAWHVESGLISLLPSFWLSGKPLKATES